MAGRLVAAVGGVLAIVGVFLDALLGESYWDVDGTLAWTGLALAGAAVLLAVGGFARRELDGWTFAAGALLAGYWAWFPALTAFEAWDHTGAGMWLCLGGGLLVAAGAALVLFTEGEVRTSPRGVSPAAALTGIGIALVFPGIFLHAEQAAGSPGWSYWDPPVYGHSLGIVMLALAALSGAAWLATVAGLPTRGVDAALTLALLGLVAFDPVWTAFNDLGNLEVGAWLALAGGILAAGGTWAARGESPRVSPETETGSVPG